MPKRVTTRRDLQKMQDRIERRRGQAEGAELLSAKASPPSAGTNSAAFAPAVAGGRGADPYARPASEGARGYRSITTGGIGPLAGQAPVPAPSQAAVPAVPDGMTRGVPGTPITSGFISPQPLEYNPELHGRTAVQKVYPRMKFGSGQVYATLEAIRRPILSAKWEVVDPDEETTRTNKVSQPVSSTGSGKQTSSKNREVVAFVRNNLFGGLEFRNSLGRMASQSWSDVVANATLMVDYGCVAHENIYQVDGQSFRLRELASRHPMTFYQWDVEDDGRTLRAIIQYGWRKSSFLNVRLEDFCLFTYRQEAADFWGRPIMRAMYPHWYIVDGLYRIDAIANERNSLGIPVFKLSPGFAKEDRDAAYTFVTSLAAHEATGMVEPPGDQNSGLRIVGYEGRIRDVMPSIQHHNSMISKAGMASFIDLGTEGKGGSRALGESQSKIFLLGLQGAADQIADCITHQTIRPLVELNFGLGAPVPRLAVANVQSRSLEDIVEALTGLATAGMVVSEQEVRDFIRKELALPAETRNGIVAIRGEAIDAEKGAARGPIMGKGAAPQPGESAASDGTENAEPGQSQKPKGQNQKQEMSAVARASRPRTEPSPFWDSPVAPSEKHVDWREVQANADRGQVALRKALGRAKLRVIQDVAHQYAAQTAKGKAPSQVTIAHDQGLDDQLAPIVQGIYDAARGHVRDEVKRLHIAKHGSVPAIPALPPAPRATFAAGGADTAATAPNPDLIAEGLVQKMLARYGASAASMASDLSGQIPGEEDIASGLNDLSDGFLDDLAGQGARQSSALGRYDELENVDDEIQANGGRYERSEILDQNTCAPCAAGDGQSWDSFDEIDWHPGDDCEGGDNCRGTVIAVFG
ncbi:MAG TPA: DUF935 family protein [Terriglobia bacterium]|nr:DUF935 family protein [Terriglobia bacterium]